ncbi:MAG: gamma-glutamylcyclotransferase [Leptolyngbyaceae cyanobacterium RM2_2_4]|nr:gamma-glutamylcyclotransferase [Leptolyngbyaceae cyanobacterium SM1_4_3]NJN91584.1 gamma-glutamylcyclotransferase [Leptolyngbyaceae cyanobacterium SL_5_14]NJO49699.1 gamma-glutamylcyclotransferase [Leptolyngbyaceae cyanobacterium RM2_2_4]
MLQQSLVKVFVYGTLKPDEASYERYCAGKVAAVCEAIAPGQLFALPMGYPAMTLGEGWVYGFLLSFADPAVLKDLDEWENYHPDRPAEENEYQREEIEVGGSDRQPLGKAWVYRMSIEQVERCGGVLLTEGRWSSSNH